MKAPPPEPGGPAVADAAPTRPRRALTIAILGAESTGKSALARALAARLADEFGLRCAVVGEYLREWCDERRRTPRADEQGAIAREQQRRIEACAARDDVDVVLGDTTPLMTAVYSELLFGDGSIDDFAREAQRGMDVTLLTALDLPWVADGLQRDGPQVRGPVDRAIRARLLHGGIGWSVVSGVGDARVHAALDVVRPRLRGLAEAASGDPPGPASTGPGAATSTPAARLDGTIGGGLFSRLAAATGGPARAAWVCDRCDDASCEHRARRPRAD